MHKYLTLAALAALSPLLLAQDKFRAADYLPNDHHNTVFADLAKLRDTGVWDELEVGTMGMFLQMMEREAGFALREIDRVTMVPMPPLEDTENGSSGNRRVVVIEGNTELDVPDWVLNDSSYVDEKIGGHEVKHTTGWSDSLFFLPTPKAQVLGATSLLRQVLEGKPNGGMPCADILSLLSGRGDSLAYVVVHIADKKLSNDFLDMVFPGVEWPADDEPQYMLMRLYPTGEADDPELHIEAVMRHAQSGDGIAVTEKAVADLLAKGLEQPQLRMVAPLLKKAERSRDRTDVVVRIALGRGRTAAGNLAMMMMPMMMVGEATAQPVQVLEVEETEAVEEPPPPPPAEKGKGAACSRMTTDALTLTAGVY